MKFRMRAAAAALAMSAAGFAHAQATVNAICSVQREWCQTLANEFTRADQGVDRPEGFG